MKKNFGLIVQIVEVEKKNFYFFNNFFENKIFLRKKEYDFMGERYWWCMNCEEYYFLCEKCEKIHSQIHPIDHLFVFLKYPINIQKLKPSFLKQTIYAQNDNGEIFNQELEAICDICESDLGCGKIRYKCLKCKNW